MTTLTLKKGFTLIELLVVIAIVAMLSAAVLSQLGTARQKGSDSAIKSTMAAAPNAAQLYYDIYNSSDWTGVCLANNGLGPIMTRLATLTTGTTCNGLGQNGWRVTANLKYQTGVWCVDYTGTKTLCSAAPSGSYTCPAGC